MLKSVLVVLKMFILFPILFVYSVWDKKKNPRCKIYGIEGYFGLMGQGKTLSMTRRLMKLRKKLIRVLNSFLHLQCHLCLEFGE